MFILSFVKFIFVPHLQPHFHTIKSYSVYDHQQDQ